MGVNMDAICMTYHEDSLAQVIDMRASAGNANFHDGEPTRGRIELSRSVSRAVHHCGVVVSEEGGEIDMSLDLSALPLAITDLYFVTAPEDKSQLASELKLQITDKCRGSKLNEYVRTPCEPNATVIMCSLSRTESGKWIVRGLGREVTDHADLADYEPIRAALVDCQQHHLNWERREGLVKLRVLRKLERMTKDSTSDFANLLNGIMELPVPVFQLVIKWL